MRTAIGRALVLCTILFAIVVVVENVATAQLLPRVPARLETDFSPAFLQRELREIRSDARPVVFLGDSVLWGYRLPAQDGAVSLLRARGCTCLNLAFKAGSPPNYDVLARLLDRNRVHPASVVLEIDQKVFNAVDDSYAKLHPALATLGGNSLSSGDRDLLAKPAPDTEPAHTTDAVLESFWLPYAMRSDIREMLSGDDATIPRAPTADDLDSTYDLSPLTPQNVGVHFLADTAAYLRRERVPTIAFFTPTNHKLVGEYIDNPQYRARAAYLRTLLEARGVRVLDFDTAIPDGDFFDEVHLTIGGQRKLAALLAPALR